MDQIVNVIKYFSHIVLDESLVLKLVHSEDIGEVEFVIDYAGEVLEKIVSQFAESMDSTEFKPANSQRTFQQYVFKEVYEFKRENTSILFKQGNLTNYVAKEGIPSVVVTGIELDKKNCCYFIIIYLSSFGRCSFKFKNILINQRIGFGKKKNSQLWEYTDITTGEVFDFYNPFPTTLWMR